MSDEDLRDRLAKLPHRAIAAFAARCVRRVRPLASSLSEESRKTIDTCIVAADSFARGIGVSKAHKAAMEAAIEGFEVAKSTTTDVASYPPWAVTITAVDAARIVVRAAGGAEVDEIVKLALKVAERASKAAKAAGDSYESIKAHGEDDLKRLLALGLGEPGSLGPPIDPSVSGPLGLLWPGEAPPWFTYPTMSQEERARIEPAGDAELVVEIDVPEDATDEDVLALVGELVLHADDVHRSLGGHGLKVERLEVHQDAGAPVGGPRG